jgi:hypothetical protein
MGLVTLLRTLTPYIVNDWQVSDDDTVIQKGADYFILVRPGAFPYQRQTERLSTVYWNVVMDLFVRYKDYKESWNKFKAFRAVVFSLLMENPTLGGAAGVVQVNLTGEEGPQYLKFSDVPDAKPNFIVQTVRAVIAQYVLVADTNF